MNEDAGQRAEKYIANVEKALESLVQTDMPATIAKNDVTKVVDTVRRYVSDSEYYLQSGKSMTALASISYAEGLLDAIKFLGLAKFSWENRGE
jgi:FAD synthetase